MLLELTEERYKYLLVCEEQLKRLEAGGVDNWDWYHESLNPKDSPSMEEFEESLSSVTDSSVTDSSVPRPMATHVGLLTLQLCVPKDWTDEQIVGFANSDQPTGISSQWSIRKEGHPALDGTPERVDCTDRVGFIHVTLEC